MYKVNGSEDSQCHCLIHLAILSFKLVDPRFASRYRQDFFSSPNLQIGFVVHPASYILGTGILFWGVERPGRVFYHLPPSSVEFKNDCSYVSIFRICVHAVERTALPLTFQSKNHVMSGTTGQHDSNINIQNVYTATTPTGCMRTVAT
jgi:hypothetical protein